MRARALKRAVKRTLASWGGWRLFGPVLRAPGVSVLMYHRILGRDRSLPGLPVEAFAAHMRWVRDNCDPIGLEAFPDRALRPSRVRPAVLVTFDDGYRDYHDLAYPVLKELRIPAAVFVVTSLLDSGGMLWTDRVRWAALSTRRERVSLPWARERPIALPDEAARVGLGDLACRHLKSLPDTERRAALEELLAETGEPPPRGREMLCWDEVRRTMDLTTYGGHSHTHPILSRVDRAEAEREIGMCKDRLVAETGRVPTAFAYPNGGPGDYTAETREILRQHGFRIAFSTSEGIAGPDSDWMAVKRLPGAGGDVPDFVWFAAGLSRA